MSVTKFRVVKATPFTHEAVEHIHYVLVFKTNVYSANTMTFEEDPTITLEPITEDGKDYLNITGKFIAEPEDYVEEDTGVTKTGWALKSQRVVTFG